MVFVTGTITLLSKLVGGVASSTLGWATQLLFGRVPQAKKKLLDAMALAAVGWLLCVIALASPTFEHLVVSSVPRPGFVDLTLIGFVLLLGAIALPACVGAATLLLADERNPVRALGHLLRGYPLTIVLLGTILFLAAWGVVRAIRTARRGWTSLHIPMLVKPDRYDRVVEDLGDALAEAGLGVERTVAPAWFVVPPKLLALVGGLGAANLVPDRLTAFTSPSLRILVYPSDVALIGKTEAVALARTAIVQRLAFTDAYLTATKEAEQVEDELRQLARRNAATEIEFAEVDDALAALPVAFEDWLTLYRLRLQVEHEGRQRAAAALSRQAS
jgi:hypothetical protein